MKRAFLLLCLLISTVCAFAQRHDVVGYYHSNFAANGFFATQIQLNTDSTFNYQFAGDLFNDVASGTYYVDHDTIHFIFKPDIPDTFWVIHDTIINHWHDNTPDSVDTVIRKIPFVRGMRGTNMRPDQLYYRRGKLLQVENHQVLKMESQKYCRFRRFLFFGTRYRMKKYYLEKDKKRQFEEWFKH